MTTCAIILITLVTLIVETLGARNAWTALEDWTINVVITLAYFDNSEGSAGGKKIVVQWQPNTN